MYLVSRDKVTKSINEEGLGLHKAHIKSLTLPTKLSWRPLKERNKFQALYLCKRYVHNKSKPKACASPIWQPLRTIESFLKSGLRWLPLMINIYHLRMIIKLVQVL